MEIYNYLTAIDFVNIFTFIIKTFFIIINTYYTFLRLINLKKILNNHFFQVTILSILITIIFTFIKYKFDSFSSGLFLIFSLSCVYCFFTKNKLGKTLLITIISISINYFLFILSTIIGYIIVRTFKISNDYISLFIMLCVYQIFLYLIFKIKRFKNGFSFLNKNFENEYFDILVLNIGVIIQFSIIILNYSDFFFSVNLFITLIIFAIIMFITIKKAFTMYYKHKLLVNELESIKTELEEKNKEIANLEAENLEFSKTAHSIAHKQKSLEYKLNKLMLQTEVAEELDLRDRLDDISKECFESTASTPLPKTEIEIIDDMISCMSSECKENHIDFELQLNGNIHHIINTFVTKEELEILLADHIKDAIIAINYSDNINKSILVKLGLYDGEYILSIYDSGIEFEIETLINLGVKPSTTHKEDGGTGMGFMNTFDTLRKQEASLYINEIGKPSKDNYTKSVTICFNNKNEYKISSYRTNEIKEQNKRDDLIIEYSLT